MRMRSFVFVRFISCIIIIFNGVVIAKRQPIKTAGCWYDGKRHQELSIVNTTEPCLHCRCIDGSVRCRLRVCPRLPSILPSGCNTRMPHENACCGELVCKNLDAKDVVAKRTNDNGCFWEGVHYGIGSAMMGSRRCEYCYCIAGERRCVRPKCLLPLPGCTPLYVPYTCCPIAYNCTHSDSPTTLASLSGNGCQVGNRIYVEGEMVRNITWKSTCDNCFCAMGGVRCVPLACAPPLRGCTPIVRQGQCCPSTYNCSGSIQVNAEQNYASYAFISKDYAKFRKETNFFLMDELKNSTIEGRSHRAPETLSSSVDVDFLSNSTPSEDISSTADTTLSTLIYETETMNNEIPTESVEIVTTWTTNNEPETSSSIDESSYTFARITTSESSTFNPSSDSRATDVSLSLEVQSTVVTDDDIITTHDFINLPNKINSSEMNIENKSQQLVKMTLETAPDIIYETTKLPLKNNGEFNNKMDVPDVMMENWGTMKGPATGSPTTILMPDNIFIMNVTLKTNVSVGMAQGFSVSPNGPTPTDSQGIVNITDRNKGEDYEYDYSEPTLPPSLPNVRIIPFVAADALVKDKDVVSSVTAYPMGSVGVAPELRPTDIPASGSFYDIVTQENRFSPPVETEGGFVPREPTYFDSPYHPPDLSLEIGTGVTVASDSNADRKNDESLGDCLLEDRAYRHGELLPSSGQCIVCMCYFSEVVCSDEKCSPVNFGCHRVPAVNSCCGQMVCDTNPEDSPTMVLEDRGDAQVQRQPIVTMDGVMSPDAFHDVIKTEPAPDLPSLIEHMVPYYVDHQISTSPLTTPMTFNENQTDSKFHNPVDKITFINTDNFDRNDGIFIADSDNQYFKEDSSIFTDIENDKNWGDIIFGKYNEKGNKSTAIISDNYNSTDIGMTTKSSNEYFLTNPQNFQLPNDNLDGEFSLDSMFDMLFPTNVTLTTAVTTEYIVNSSVNTQVSANNFTSNTTWSSTNEELTKVSMNTAATVTTTPKSLENKSTTAAVSGLLKLAGCNIYGRMYRVGRIIAELSSPCLECRCTEIGVQCKQLEC